jgi:hypothetical protein
LENGKGNTMDYEIKELVSGSAKVQFADGAWADVPILNGDTKSQFEVRVANYATKTVDAVPSWANVGDTGSVAQTTLASSVGVFDDSNAPTDPDWLKGRKEEYGSVDSQIEYIAEKGLAAWQTEVARIKTKYPQP